MFEQLQNRIPGIIDIDIQSQYSVLVPLIEKEDGYYILFEKRSENLIHQPGEICFPGGKCEAKELPKETVIRETCEELLLDKANIQLIASLDILVSPFNFVIYPYLGAINDYKNQYNPSEVAEVFYVPLAFFMKQEPEVYYNAIEMRPSEDIPYEDIADGNRYQWKSGEYEIGFYRYEGKVIWGVTAKIVKSLVNILKSDD